MHEIICFKIALISLGLGKANMHKSFIFGYYPGFFLPTKTPLVWNFELHKLKYALRGKYAPSSLSRL